MAKKPQKCERIHVRDDEERYRVKPTTGGKGR